MVDLTAEMAQLLASLGPARPGQARVIQLVAASAGEGTSTVARELARFAAGRARKPVWLIDLDLMNSTQYAAVAADPARYGVLGRATAASPDGSAFFTIQPPARGADGRPWRDSRYMVAHPVGGPNLWVTRFRREALIGEQTAHVMPTGDYWNALRQFAELVVIDAPSADRSRAAMTIAPFIDFTILVVSDGADPTGPTALRDAIHAAGGQCAGIVFNRATLETPSFIKAFLP